MEPKKTYKTPSMSPGHYYAGPEKYQLLIFSGPAYFNRLYNTKPVMCQVIIVELLFPLLRYCVENRN